MRDELLHSYGTTDDPQFVRVPINRAIQHLAGKLPVRKSNPGAEAHDRGLLDAGESNSGRMFRRISP
jgi:hypothetical protein